MLPLDFLGNDAYYNFRLDDLVERLHDTWFLIIAVPCSLNYDTPTWPFSLLHILYQNFVSYHFVGNDPLSSNFGLNEISGSGWELALVTTPSNHTRPPVESKLVRFLCYI